MYSYSLIEKYLLTFDIFISEMEHDCLSNPDSTADLTDVSNVHEVEEDLKEDIVKEEITKKEEENDKNVDEVTKQLEEKPESLETLSTQSKMDSGSNHENNDAVEDCINLNLEDEENFDEVSLPFNSNEDILTNNFNVILL